DRGGFGVRLAAVADHQLLEATQTVFVPWDDKKLEVSFATFRDRLRPGGRETWRVTVRSPLGGAPELAAAELLAYMYDRSLDAFRPPRPPEPLSVYPNRAYIGTEHASLGQAYAQWVSNEDFGMVSFPPPLAPDRLKFLEGYGLGGPGRRGGILSDAVISRATVPTAPGPGEPQAMAMRAEQGTGAVASPAPAPPAAALVELRGNFAETAFWMPHL